ncbi:hypothetical protein D3C73_1623420 [compost metagenome]
MTPGSIPTSAGFFISRAASAFVSGPMVADSIISWRVRSALLTILATSPAPLSWNI